MKKVHYETNFSITQIDHSMILFLFIHFLSAQLYNDPAYKHFEHALAKNSATHIFLKLSKEPVAHYKNDQNDGLENMRFFFVRNFDARKHPGLG